MNMKGKIEEYCNRFMLKPRIDSSNLKDVYTRNKVRLNLIPYIAEVFNPNIIDSIIRMSTILKDDYDYLEQSSNEALAKSIISFDELCNEIAISISMINSTHTSIRRRLIRTAIRKINNDLNGITNIHIGNIDDLCLNGRTGAKINLPHKICVERSYNA